MARLEGLIAGKLRTMDEIPMLQAGGLFPPRVAAEVRQRAAQSIETLRGELDQLREEDLDVQVRILSLSSNSTTRRCVDSSEPSAFVLLPTTSQLPSSV